MAEIKLELPPFRKFSEVVDLVLVLKDPNNTEEAYKWAWLHAFETVLQRSGILATTNIYGCDNNCSEDGMMKIWLTPECCKYMGFDPKTGMGITLNMGIEAKRLRTPYPYRKSEYASAAFMQRLWYDYKIYNNHDSFDMKDDIIATCTEKYFAMAYYKSNKQLIYDVFDFFDTLPAKTTASKLYSEHYWLQKQASRIKWDHFYNVDDKLKVEDIILQIFEDLLNGSIIANVAGR